MSTPPVFVPTPLPSDTLRLPAYRESHRYRSHPYPRPPPRQSFVDLMTTVDYRDVEETRRDTSFSFSLPAINEVDEDVDDDTVENLERALGNSGSTVKSRRRLSAVIVDLAFAVLGRCQGIKTVKKSTSITKLDPLN